MNRYDCIGYKNPNECNILKHKECEKCKFYKTKKEVYLANKKALARCKKLGLYDYIPVLKIMLKQKGVADE